MTAPGAPSPPLERLVAVADGVELCLEEHGGADDPVLLLLGGATWSMDWWEDALCERLVAHGLRVVRYDHRDTGRSTCWPVGAPGYGARELSSDPLALLDALEIGTAHLVGLSMGGGIAQGLAVEHPGRVASLTLMATSPIDPAVTGLPGPTAALQATWTQERPAPDQADHEAVAAALVEEERDYQPAAGFERERLLAVARRVVARSAHLASAANHLGVVAGDDAPVASGALGRITAPALVVHGVRDPLFPVEHGRALAAAIPGAELLELDAMGHGLPPTAAWEELVGAIARTVARAGA